jgi:hypothetical protein
MDAVLKSMVQQRRGQGYDYITPHVLFERNSSREYIYKKIKDIKKHMYDWVRASLALIFVTTFYAFLYY